MTLERQGQITQTAFPLPSGIVKDDAKERFERFGLGVPVDKRLGRSVEKNHRRFFVIEAVTFVIDSTVIFGF